MPMIPISQVKLINGFLLVLLISCSGCFLFKEQPRTSTPETNVPTSNTQKNDKPIVKVTPQPPPVIDKESVPKTEIIVIDEKHEEDALLSKNFNIAFLLPFNVKLNTLDFDNNDIDDKSKIALEFYEGALMALEDLKNEGLSFTVHVYDTEKDAQKVQYLLNQDKMKDMDLIVGPVYNQTLKKAEEFSRRNKIFLISPLSPKASFVQDNPYYLNASSSINTHSEFIHKYLQRHSLNNITVVHSDKPNEYKLADLFLRYNTHSPFDTTIVERTGMVLNQFVYSDQDNKVFTSYLDEYRENVFIVSSVNSLIVNEILSRLYLYATRYDITVIGMPNWYKFTDIDPIYFEELNVHLSNNFYKNPASLTVQEFESMYLGKMNVPPSEYACKGYDLINHFGSLLAKYPKEARLYGLTTHRKAGVFTGYQFEPIFSDTSNNINFHENTYLHLLRFTDYNYQKVH